MKNEFTGYDYKEVTVEYKKLSFYLDCYENFGWHLDERFNINSESSTVVLHLKRDRKIINKTELTRLQRHFEACADELVMLEKSKSTLALMIALTIGIIGCVLATFAVFALTAHVPNIGLGILFIFFAFICLALPPFLYYKTVDLKSKKITPFIEQKYDEIYEICQKGHDLL